MILAPETVAYWTAATAASRFTPSASPTLQIIRLTFQQTPEMPIMLFPNAPMMPAT